MNEKESKQNATQKLTDDELKQVVGGFGVWGIDEEEDYRKHYEYDGCPGTFEDYIFAYWRKRGLCDDRMEQYLKECLIAREAWIARGSDPHTVYRYVNGELITFPSN